MMAKRQRRELQGSVRGLLEQSQRMDDELVEVK